MTSVRRSLAISLSSQYVSIGLSFVATIFIARLLTPAEVGIFSIGAAFVLLGNVLRDFGSGQYIVQEKDLTEARIRAAFAVTLGFGVLTASVVFLLAPIVADFYEQPGVQDVLHLLALNFALLPFGTITVACLQREMAFNKTATISVTAKLVQASTSVGCAFAGLSYMSMAWGALAGTLTSILMAAVFRPRGLPLFPGLREIRRVLGFSGSVSTSALLAQFSKAIPELIVGKLLGVASVGLYSRGRGVIDMFEMLVMRGLNPVLVPLFARKDRAGDKLATSLLYGIGCLTGLAWSFYGGLAVLAPEFIVTLFGDKWAGSAPLVQIWCVGLAISQSIRLSGNLMIATGNVNVLLRTQLITAPVGVVMVLAAAHYSLEAVAWVSIPGGLLWLSLMLPKAMRIAQFTLSDYLRAIVPSLAPAVACTTAAVLVKYGLLQLGMGHPALILVLAGLAGALAWLATLLVTGHPLAGELRMAADKVLKRLRKRPRSTG